MEISICTNTFVNYKNTRKVKFSGQFCSDIESMSSILSAAWNKTNSSSNSNISFSGIFPGNDVGVLKSDGLHLES